MDCLLLMVCVLTKTTLGHGKTNPIHGINWVHSTMHLMHCVSPHLTSVCVYACMRVSMHACGCVHDRHVCSYCHVDL